MLNHAVGTGWGPTHGFVHALRVLHQPSQTPHPQFISVGHRRGQRNTLRLRHYFQVPFQGLYSLAVATCQMGMREGHPGQLYSLPGQAASCSSLHADFGH